MVLLGTFHLDSAYGLLRGAAKRGLQLEALNQLTLENIFFKLCKACQLRTMSCIPPSAFSAGRIRETQRDRDMKLSNPSKSNETTKFFNSEFMELTPLKYNSKLMNSIWGFYNRYSPHNVKKVNENAFNVNCQQFTVQASRFRPRQVEIFKRILCPVVDVLRLMLLRNPNEFNVEKSAGNSTNKSEPMITLPPSKLDKVWAVINF